MHKKASPQRRRSGAPFAKTKKGAKPRKLAAAKDGPRRSSTYGLKSASAYMETGLRSASTKRGVADPRVVTRWREIVGDRLGASTRPVRIKHRGGMALGGDLIIAVEPAKASEIEHELPLIAERVNAFFGYRAIAEVKITQTVALRAPQKPAPAPRAAEILPDAARARLEETTADVEDDALRAALTRLGANVIRREQVRKSKAASE